MHNATNINNGRSVLTPSEDYAIIKKQIAQLKIHNDDKIFIHVARCSKEKNQELLINVFNKFIDNGEHAILILIGASYDAPEHKYLLNKAHKGIYWLGTKNNVCDYLFCSDFFILSSLWEGLPISLLEAISVGVIPICTPAGGIPDVIINQKIGFVSKDFNQNSFYATIEEAYNKYANFNRNHLKAYFKERFSMQTCANQYSETFKQKLQQIS